MEWQMCCRGRRSACPQIAVDGRTVYIRDDFGGQISVTLDQFQDIRWKLDEIISARIPKTSKSTFVHYDSTDS